jgi:glycerol kinase
MGGTLTLAIDQGTHATRAIIFDDQGRPVVSANRPVALQVHGRTVVEQSPEEILDSLNAVLGEVLEHPRIDPACITSAGLATQRSSVLAWDRCTGRALSPVLSWQDTRISTEFAALRGHEAEIREHTGLQLSPHYGAGKLRWLLRNSPAVAAARTQGVLALGPLVGFLLHHLTGVRTDAVDHANASRTLLWNLGTRDWDPWLLGLFAIPRELLPACRPILADYGMIRGRNIPLCAVNGDQTAALYACGPPAYDALVVNIGTGAFALLPTGNVARAHPALLSGISCSDNEAAEYFLEGTVNGAGAALDWVAERYRVADWPAQLPGWIEGIKSPPVFLNSIGGLGAPWWQPGPEPVFLTEGTAAPVGPAEAMTATVESIVFLIQANVELLQAVNPAVARIRISGGLAALDGLCRKLADLSGLVVERSAVIESTARGIAWLAAGCPAEWSPPEVERRFLPREDARLGQRYAQFCTALESTLRPAS